jgi:tetratricopeptide (TPR) repeat protein
MTELEELYSKIYSDKETKNPKQFIDIYEANKTLIESSDIQLTNPGRDGIMRLTSDYALSLSHYGSSKKSIPYLNKAIQLFKDSSFDDLTKLSMYEALVWTRGVENYNQKNYKAAAEDFKYLVDNYPDNDKYKNWLLGAKTIPVKKWLNFIWTAACVTILIEAMTSKNKEPMLKSYTLYLATMLFSIAIMIEIFIWLTKRKIKQK